MDYKRIIKDYMKIHRVTYEDLARALGVSKQRAWAMLNGKNSISLKTLEKVAKALGLELSLM